MGAGLDHSMEKILSSPHNFREVKELYVFGMTKEEFLRKPATATNLEYDVALLELEKPWIFNKQTNVFPACLIDYERYFFDGEFLATGYGQRKPQNITKPKISQMSSKFFVRPASRELSSSDRGSMLMMTKLRSNYMDFHFLSLYNPQSSICFGTEIVFLINVFDFFLSL